MHMVASTIFRMNIFVSAVQDLKEIFGPSFFNLKAILFTMCEVYHRAGGDAERNS